MVRRSWRVQHAQQWTTTLARLYRSGTAEAFGPFDNTSARRTRRPAACHVE
jgi:hypothetical protein